MVSSPTKATVGSEAEIEEVTLALPVDLLQWADETAAKQGWSREQVLRQGIEYYLSTLRWQEIHRVFAPQAAAAGLLTEDDVEDYLDSLSPDPA
jgi:hypothetical protein